MLQDDDDEEEEKKWRRNGEEIDEDGCGCGAGVTCYVCGVMGKYLDFS